MTGLPELSKDSDSALRPARSDGGVPERVQAPVSVQVSPEERAAAAQQMLESLVELGGRFIASQAEAAERTAKYDENVLQSDERTNRRLIYCATFLVALLLGIVAYLFYRDRFGEGVDLVKLIATIVGVGFGGYGVARIRAKEAE